MLPEDACLTPPVGRLTRCRCVPLPMTRAGRTWWSTSSDAPHDLLLFSHPPNDLIQRIGSPQDETTRHDPPRANRDLGDVVLTSARCACTWRAGYKEALRESDDKIDNIDKLLAC